MATTKRTTTMYDIAQYSDSDLYRLLDFSTAPSDKELDAKIVAMSRKSSGKVKEMYDNIYDRFFEQGPQNAAAYPQEGF